MSKRQEYMELVSLGVASVTLTPDVGEGILVKDIQVIPTVGVTEFLTVNINRKTVGFFHLGTAGLNQLPLNDNGEQQKTLIKRLTDLGHNFTFPIADGETMTLTAPNPWTILRIIYETYDSSDISPEMVNGSRAEEYYFMQYGTNGAIFTTAGSYELLSVHNPQEFPVFPFGGVVPAKTNIEIIGVGFPDFITIDAGGVNAQRTSRLRFFRDREVLFNTDRLGFYVLGPVVGALAPGATHYFQGVTTLPYGGEGNTNSIYTFQKPLLFDQGEELSVFLDTVAIAADEPVPANTVFCALPLHVKRV